MEILIRIVFLTVWMYPGVDCYRYSYSYSLVNQWYLWVSIAIGILILIGACAGWFRRRNARMRMQPPLNLTTITTQQVNPGYQPQVVTNHNQAAQVGKFQQVPQTQHYQPSQYIQPVQNIQPLQQIQSDQQVKSTENIPPPQQAPPGGIPTGDPPPYFGTVNPEIL